MTNDTIATSVAQAIIYAPAQSVDLTNWVFTLTDSEYQACSKDHIAAAASITTDGRRMSLNVERVGNLMVQHYVEDIAERSHCRLVSLSDSIGPDIGSGTKVTVVWDFVIEPIDSSTSRFTNSVEVRATPAYRQALDARGIPFIKASEAAGQAVTAHNLEETPLFALDIERKIAAKRWE